MSRRKISKIQRSRHRREPKKRFVLFCEGKNTEPAYFKAIKQCWTSALISVEPRPGVGVPTTIAETAVQFAKDAGVAKGSRRRRNSFEERDEVWAVFDRDEHDGFSHAVNLCEAKGVRVARSNPCFEL